MHTKLISLAFCVGLLVVNSFAQVPGRSSQPRGPSVSICTGGVLNMKALHLPEPLYPPEARRTVQEQTLTVMVEVSEQGNVTSAIACAGVPLLRRFAEDAAKAAKIGPTILGGVPVKVSGVLIYPFDPETSYSKPIVLSCGNDRVRQVYNLKILNGYATELVKPNRPQDAPKKLSGAVSVKITVNENGKPENVEVISGHPQFRPAAEEAARRSTFRRFVRCGKPTKVTSVLTYNFPWPADS